MQPSIVRRAITRFRLHILRDPLIVASRQWHRDGGDQTIRFDYPLTTNSLVFDIGGFKGAWAQTIHAKYSCRIRIFEPIPAFLAEIENRFQDNSKITISPYALSDTSGTVTFYDLEQGSGAFFRRPGAKEVQCETKAITDVIAEVDGDIDLMKMNIEGGEYEILPALLNNGIERVKNLTIQFHNFIPNASAKRDAIREQLRRTHIEQWCYPFVWENWKRRDALNTA